ncbi:MAG: hypothetical protein QM757_16050 [Paludibaculum sp.]
MPQIASTLSSLLGKSFFADPGDGPAVARSGDRWRGRTDAASCWPGWIIQINGYQYVQLDQHGKLVPRGVDTQRAAFWQEPRVSSLDIERAGEKPASLVYVSRIWTTPTWRDNTPFKTYVAGLGKSCTLLKSTSYMMHSDGFKIIRQMVLDDSALIIQDDSGVPWKYFTPEQWKVQLYGDYVSPLVVNSSSGPRRT